MAFAESGDASIRLKVLALDDDGLVRRVLEDLLAGEHDFREGLPVGAEHVQEAGNEYAGRENVDEE